MEGWKDGRTEGRKLTVVVKQASKFFFILMQPARTLAASVSTLRKEGRKEGREGCKEGRKKGRSVRKEGMEL